MSTEVEASSPAKAVAARTRSTGVTFEPPETYDMVRSLFDPTLKKSFLECCITLTLLANIVLCYWSLHRFGLHFTKWIFSIQYIIWRIGYNLGIGIILHNQSHYETLTQYAKRNRLFHKDNKTLLAKLCQFEISSKMPNSYNMYKQPEELNVWLLFRQFVDLILMQDFTTYMLFVYLSLPEKWSDMYTWQTGIGIAMVLFNVWVKLDAHRVVKDFAWYWGDFFFLQDSELIFDGVFNISPHPMYSIGYLGYYGLSIMCGDYKVLLVSIWGHLLQFLFLKYVETPHIERTYGGGNDAGSQVNSAIDDLIAKENYDYSRPLINNGFWFINFQKLRFTDYFTVSTIFVLSSWAIVTDIDPKLMFWFTFITKLVTWLGVSLILFEQSTRKWFTKLFLKNGYTQLYSYQQWQFIFNFTLVVTNTLLAIQTLSKCATIYPDLDYSQFLFGLILCSLQIWCNSEMRSAISDFGWFYGDFFLTNYITTRKLTSQGIYRYLNNPEAILGIAGAWGTVLMTNFCVENIVLASLWTITNFIFVKFIEQPHMAKIYGTTNRVSGVEKTLLGLKPLKMISEFMDKLSNNMMRSLSNPSNNDNSTGDSTDDCKREKIATATNDDSSSSITDWSLSSESLSKKTVSKYASDCEFEIENFDKNGFVLPNPITITWKIPLELYNETDWVGLYNVLETSSDRHKTRVSSMGHWSATCPTAYSKNRVQSKSVLEFSKNDKEAMGKIVFGNDLLYFEPGIYELRYHSRNSYKVLLTSHPFKISFPQLNTNSVKDLYNDLMTFLTESGTIKSMRFTETKYFNSKVLQHLIKESLGVDISVYYIGRVNGDIDVIAKRLFEIREILDKL